MLGPELGSLAISPSLLLPIPEVAAPNHGDSHAWIETADLGRKMPSDCISHSSQVFSESRSRAGGVHAPALRLDCASGRCVEAEWQLLMVKDEQDWTHPVNLGPQRPTHCPAALGLENDGAAGSVAVPRPR